MEGRGRFSKTTKETLYEQHNTLPHAISDVEFSSVVSIKRDEVIDVVIDGVRSPVCGIGGRSVVSYHQANITFMKPRSRYNSYYTNVDEGQIPGLLVSMGDSQII